VIEHNLHRPESKLHSSIPRNIKKTPVIERYISKIDEHQYQDSLESLGQEIDQIHYAQVIAALRVIKK
jgi:hypothetical protein